MSKINNQTKQDFYNTFFEGDKYQEKEVNGYWLIKRWDGRRKCWEVALYSKEAYDNYKNCGYSQALFDSI